MITVVLKDDYWRGMVEYYYKNVQLNDSRSIWQWIANDFACKGGLYSNILQFSSEQDLTAFKLTIPKN